LETASILGFIFTVDVAIVSGYFNQLMFENVFN